MSAIEPYIRLLAVLTVIDSYSLGFPLTENTLPNKPTEET